MLHRILVIAREPQWARTWADKNITAHDRMPITCGLVDCHSYLVGARDLAIILVDLLPENLGDAAYKLRRNTVITVKE